MEKHLPSHFEVLSHNATTASVVVKPTLQISETLTGGINSILSKHIPSLGVLIMVAESTVQISRRCSVSMETRGTAKSHSIWFSSLSFDKTIHLLVKLYECGHCHLGREAFLQSFRLRGQMDPNHTSKALLNLTEPMDCGLWSLRFLICAHL